MGSTVYKLISSEHKQNSLWITTGAETHTQVYFAKY